MSLTRRQLGHLGAYAVLVPFAIVTLVPLAWLLIAAFKGPEDFYASVFLPPGDGAFGVAWDRLTLDNLRRIFIEVGIGRAMLNSLFYASTTSLLACLCCAMAGYALARYEFRGRRLATVLVIGAIVLPAPLLLAPGYQWLFRLGLLDTRAGLILPAIAPAFGVYLFRQATIQGVPHELLEAARLDGSSELRIFATIALPLLRPMVSAFILIMFLAVWNNFITPQIVLQDPDKLPLAVAIAQLKDVYYQDHGLLMAGTIISIAPVMLLFLVLQREFVAGLTMGAVKG